MLNMTPTLRFAALSTMVLGFACAGFVASASAEDVIKGAGDQKPAATDTAGHGNASSLKSNEVDVAGHGNASSLKSNDVQDVAADGDGTKMKRKDVQEVSGHGNASNLGADHIGVGSGGNPTGEGALLTGNCFADMPVYSKEGKFIGRGMVNTCN